MLIYDLLYDTIVHNLHLSTHAFVICQRVSCGIRIRDYDVKLQDWKANTIHDDIHSLPSDINHASLDYELLSG